MSELIEELKSEVLRIKDDRELLPIEDLGAVVDAHLKIFDRARKAKFLEPIFQRIWAEEVSNVVNSTSNAAHNLVAISFLEYQLYLILLIYFLD